MLTRRRLIEISLLSIPAVHLAVGSRAAAASGLSALADRFAAVEAASRGRLGVAVLDTNSGSIVGRRVDERFPMCSTFKLLAVASTLARIDSNLERLDRRIPVAPEDVLSYAPIARQHAGRDMSVAELCDASITVSDNTAANLLLAALGGPEALTRYMRALGDGVTRLDRIEPDLNEGTPGDVRDTTTPAAMARTVRELVFGSALAPDSRRRLTDWLVACWTGDAKLRAGLPSSWRVGDKTGSGGHGTSNDVAVAWPPDRAPLIIASYLTETGAPDDLRNATHAAAARAVVQALSQ